MPRKTKLISAKVAFDDHQTTSGYTERMCNGLRAFAGAEARRKEVLLADIPPKYIAQCHLTAWVETSDMHALQIEAKALGMSVSELCTRILYAYDPHYRACAERRAKGAA